MTSLRRIILSSMRVIVTSSSEGLQFPRYQIRLGRYDVRKAPTYRPCSYSLEAMGDISEWMVICPSNGRSGDGLTIFASTCASTLRFGESAFPLENTRVLVDSCLVLPKEQSTQPKSGPKANIGCLISSASLPSNLSPCLRASTTNSFSGIDGEGGLISGGRGG